jgi:O-antigen/teichoic acid export membrane protein
MLLALAAASVLIRHLHQTGYGRDVTALSIATIALGLTEGGVNTIALREFATRSGDERDRAMAGMLGVRLLLSALGLVAAISFAAAVGYSGTIVAGTAVACIGLTVQVVQTLIGVPLQATMRLGWVATADLVRNAVSALLIVALVVAGAGVVALLAVITPACIAALLLTFRLVRGEIPLRPSVDIGAYRLLLRETLPFAVAIALSSVYFRVTVVVVSLDATALQTGYFSTSFRVVEALIGLPVLVMGAAFPILTRAARDDPGRFEYATRRMFELSVLVGVWMAVVVLLGAGFAMDVLGSRSAAPAASVLRIQGVAVTGTFVAVACGFPLLSLRRYTVLLAANALGLVVTLATALALVPTLSAQGGAIATVAAEFALATASIVGLTRAWPDLRLPLGVIPVAVLAGGAGVGVGYVVDVHPVFDVLAGTAVYALALALLGRFPPEVAHLLRPQRALGADRS